MESNFLAATAGPLCGCGGSSRVNAKGDNVTHRVEYGVSEVHQQGAFLCDPDGESVRQTVRYRIGEPCLVEVDVTYCEHRWRHQVKFSFE